MDKGLNEINYETSADSTTVEKLESLLDAIEDLERQESEVQSRCIVEYAKLLAEVSELEDMLQNDVGGDFVYGILDDSINESKERLNMLKKELASKLRAILLLRRQLDDIPVPAELLQYELCFSQLYTSIQKKLRQTRKYYETFNALLEIKELMLKETSLLNSISSQSPQSVKVKLHQMLHEDKAWLKWRRCHCRTTISKNFMSVADWSMLLISFSGHP
ncbi:uncharacterized protein [Coffea arabica]|uniref:Uncharacterized protein isoform X4 n=1 Tax=Coffea arabica TaxID=13443 RepID=A0ABM4VJJ9_COFAR